MRLFVLSIRVIVLALNEREKKTILSYSVRLFSRGANISNMSGELFAALILKATKRLH